MSAAAPAVRAGYVPPDLDRANALWGASCGHGALAALLGIEVATLREHLPKPYTTPSAMRSALSALRVTHRVLEPPWGAGPSMVAPFPLRGLIFVQFTGPWCAEGVNPKAAYRHTHWIAVDDRFGVYDVNAEGWISVAEWTRDIAPQIVADEKRRDGWYWRASIEVPR